MITYLHEKSECNFKSAKELMELSLFPSSVHCSYYSCVQLMLHLLRSHFEHDETSINDVLYPPEEANKQLHANLIREFRKELKKIDIVISNTFYSQILRLKSLRGKSDYSINNIPQKLAKEAMKIAEYIKRILTNNFTV